MKKTHNTLFQLSALFIFSTLSFTNLSYAEKIYTWKDESGKMHYTNNPALVPLKKEASIIKMKAPPTSNTKNNPTISGKDIWEAQCSRCHVLSAQGRNRLRGMKKLVDAINDPSTTPTLDTIIVQEAIDDEMDDLAQITLNADEVQAVASYIRQEITQHASDDTKNSPKQQQK